MATKEQNGMEAGELEGVKEGDRRPGEEGRERSNKSSVPNFRTVPSMSYSSLSLLMHTNKQETRDKDPSEI